MDAITVEKYCNLLSRSKLMSPADVRTAYQGWRADSKQSSDTAQFAKWLVARKHLTDFQARLLLKDQAELIFLDDYKLVERIGAGRMAGVYKGIHKLGQVVAIKILPPSRSKDAEALGRFQREARLAIKLIHPNVVRTFHTAVANGMYYLVMEHLNGETLEEVLERRKKLPPAEAARIVYQALVGLQHIHEKGMVHRDLNPSNLMLVSGSDRGPGDSTLRSTVKLLDIGLGRAIFDEPGVGEAAGGAGKLTASGDVLGTPGYMAPEQAADAHSADIRADIYSLGCVLYQILAGQPPFTDSNKVRLIIRHATEQPPPIKQFNPAVPDALQEVVSRMMAKDPVQRFATPDKSAEKLRPFMTTDQEVKPSADEEVQLGAYLNWVESSYHTMGADLATPTPTVPAPPALTPSIPKPPSMPMAPPAPKPPSMPMPPTASVPLDVAIAAEPVPASSKQFDLKNLSFGQVMLILGVGAGLGLIVLVILAVVAVKLLWK